MSKYRTTSPRTTDKLLHTKLMPPRLPSMTIPRDQLLVQLDLGLSKKVTLVTAPTGYGKTTLVRMWTTSRDFQSAWLTLDQNDNDPNRFWTYVCSALRTFDPTIGKTTLSMLMASQPVSFESLLTPVINDLARLNEPAVLVLEDYHAITSTEINEAVSFFIRHLPGPFHLVLTTRSDPTLSLAIVRVRDELSEINAAHLRFDEGETKAFLHTVTSADLSSSIVNKLVQKTEGWAAGLRLLALSLQNKNRAEIEQSIESFSGRDRYVADYLIQEVFERQPEDIQSFLMETCFFRTLTRSFCDAITQKNDSAILLERLERDNLFIVELERGGDQTWFRYNLMFAESIRYLSKQQLGDSFIEALFERACNWYADHGMYDEAIQTALDANLFAHALPLIEKFIEIHDITELSTLGRWLEKIPQREILVHPAVCFSYAQVILYSTDRFAPTTATRIEPLLVAAEAACQNEKDHHRLGQLLSFRSIVVWWQGNFAKAFKYARQSLGELPESDVLWRGNSLLIVSYEALTEGRILEAQDQILEARALLGAARNIHGILAALQILSQIFYWQGELEQAEQLNKQIVVEAVVEESMLDDQGFAALSLAEIAYERNELVEAEKLARQAWDLSKQRGNEMLLVQAVIRLAYIQAARNDFRQAKDLMKQLVSGIQHPALLREIQEAHARLSILSGDLFALKAWQTLLSSDEELVLHVQKEREAFTLARLRIAEGNALEALEILKHRASDAAKAGRVRSQVTALCLEALAYYAHADSAQAAKSLMEVLTLGSAKGLCRLVLDEGPRMMALLQAISPALPDRSLSLFATALLQSFSLEMTPHSTASSPIVQIEPLSHQEVRVLRLLVAGLSNTDIAQELVVSTNTIKTHIKSIYRKLNVRSRDEARDVAREARLW